MAREDGIVGGSPAAAAPAGGATAAARHDATPNAWLDDCFAAAEAQLAALLRTGGSSHVPCSRLAGPLPVNSLPGVVVKAALAAHPNSKPDRIAAHCNGRQCNPVSLMGGWQH